MAEYRLHSKVGKVGYAHAHARYILREGNYRAKEDLVYKESGNMEWAINGSSALEFWRAADENERINGTTYREFELNIPNELNYTQGIELIKNFAKKEIGKNFPYSFAIHESFGKNGEKNLHCHFMFSERKLDGVQRELKHFFKQAYTKNPTVGGAKKDNSWRTKEKLISIRKSWEIETNKILEKYGIENRVSCENLKTQKKQALEKGDYEKAESLNREPVSINGKILRKERRLGPNSLSQKETSQIIKFEKLKEIKNEKERELKIKRGEIEPTEKECLIKLKELNKNNNLHDRALNIYSHGDFFKLNREIRHLDSLLLLNPESVALRRDKLDLEKKIENIRLLSVTPKYLAIFDNLKKNHEKEKSLYENAYRKFGKIFEQEKKDIELVQKEKNFEKYLKKYNKSQNLIYEKEKLLCINPIEKARNILTKYKLEGEKINIISLEKTKKQFESKKLNAEFFDKNSIIKFKEKILEIEDQIKEHSKKFDLLNSELDRQNDKVEILALKVAQNTKLELMAIETLIQREMTQESCLKLLVNNEKQKQLYEFYSNNNLEGKYNKQLYDTSLNIRSNENFLKKYGNLLRKDPLLLNETLKNSRENIKKIITKIEKYEKLIKKFEKNLNQEKIINGYSLQEILAANIISKGEYGKVFKEITTTSIEIDQKIKKIANTNSFSIFKKKSLAIEVKKLKEKKEQLNEKRLEIISNTKLNGNLNSTALQITSNLENSKKKIEMMLKKEMKNKINEWQLISAINNLIEKGEYQKYPPLQNQRDLGIIKTAHKLKQSLSQQTNNNHNNLDIKLKNEKEKEGWEL